jgi:hypothetical protein
LIDDRAFIFTDAATDAQIDVYDGLFDALLLAFSADYGSLLKPDSLLGSWTVFLTDNTGNPLRIGETARSVNKGKTDFGLLLFRLRKVANRPGRADLAA